MINWLAALLLTISSPTEAAGGRAALDAFADGLETLSGRFEQITVDVDGRVTEEASGTFYFRRPDRFRWDYGEPFPQQIVADGERLWHYDESLDQVTVREQPPASESPLLVLTRPELLDRFYRVVASEPERIEFVPIDEAAEIERGRLLFNEGLPARLELVDSFGQVTRLDLIDLARNPELDAGLFTFSVPEGVDVLEGY